MIDRFEFAPCRSLKAYSLNSIPVPSSSVLPVSRPFTTNSDPLSEDLIRTGLNRADNKRQGPGAVEWHGKFHFWLAQRQSIILRRWRSGFRTLLGCAARICSSGLQSGV